MPLAEVYRLYLLRPGARPRRHPPLTFGEVEDHRCVDCPAYADCLHFASRIPWEGFTCTACPAFLKKSG
jgi:hypothetical protein